MIDIPTPEQVREQNKHPEDVDSLAKQIVDTILKSGVDTTGRCSLQLTEPLSSATKEALYEAFRLSGWFLAFHEDQRDGCWISIQSFEARKEEERTKQQMAAYRANSCLYHPCNKRQYGSFIK